MHNLASVDSVHKVARCLKLQPYQVICSGSLILLGREHTILASHELMWCYTCGWDVRGVLTLNSMVQIHTSVTLLTKRDLAWSSGRLTCQHASQISAVAHISWDVTYVSSALQTLPVVSRNGGNAYQKKCANGLFLYDTKSSDYRDHHMRANAWEGIGKELKMKRKLYVFTCMFDVSSRDVTIVVPGLNP